MNDLAPAFSSTDQSGRSVSLKKLLEKGPAVLIFYRGQWCPYCNKQLKALKGSLSFISAKGATVVAVTPEAPDNVIKTTKKTKATYPCSFG